MRQAKRLQHSSYTVGWICALPLEMAAAKAMLDERHEQLPQSTRDGNSYALGEIFGHNIVIACLPFGQYGTETAATVSAEMWSTFPGIQFSLMVGVGGGVPTDIDIRLGDVVVSKPTGLYGGVSHYDQGKTLPNGRFMHTASRNRPPQKLLAAVADLYPNMSDFLHITGEDCLFQADYEHEHEGLSCDYCDKTKLIVRELWPSRSPRIHYGLVASGSQVMDAFCRDHLAKEHGIICFEMEAAGVMNNSPCLVIRGICDYADSHKSKGWELLAVMQDEPRVGEVSTSGGANLMILIDSTTLYNIFDRLSTYDPARICRNYLDRKCPNTASWISNNATFREWLSQDGHPCLWLTGKSTLH
ncbi:nucleoside phosphorylase domain-containing protein [Aspergillus germanicus]